MSGVGDADTGADDAGKTCFICRKWKPKTEFQKRAAAPDGYSYGCKICLAARDRARDLKPERAAYKIKKGQERRSDPTTRQREFDRANAWKNNNKIKSRAHDIVNYAIQRGNMLRATVCEICGQSCRPHAHHEDYSRPLDIVWLCQRCHRGRHKELNAIARAARVMS